MSPNERKQFLLICFWLTFFLRTAMIQEQSCPICRAELNWLHAGESILIGGLTNLHRHLVWALVGLEPGKKTESNGSWLFLWILCNTCDGGGDRVDEEDTRRGQQQKMHLKSWPSNSWHVCWWRWWWRFFVALTGWLYTERCIIGWKRLVRLNKRFGGVDGDRDGGCVCERE